VKQLGVTEPAPVQNAVRVMNHGSFGALFNKVRREGQKRKSSVQNLNR
jgi:hypothetical protein